MTTVILCEKKSQADAISKALSFRGMSGRHQGTDYQLSWASGHLLEFVAPDEAKPDATWRSPASLLPLPTDPKLTVSQGQSKSVKRVKDDLKGATAIVLATDPDREGEAIGRNLLAHCKTKAPITRLWLAGGMDPKSIQKAFGNLFDESDSRGLMRAQQARSTADWLYMFVTRGFTAYARAGGLGDKLGQGKGKASVASIGRVQTPTLALVHQRDQAIANFVSVTHYKPGLTIEQNGVAVTLDYTPVIPDGFRDQNTPGIEWQPQSKGDDKPLFTDRQAVDTFADRIRQLGHLSIAVGRKDGTKPAPMCYALIDLQRAASTALKLSSAKVLEIAQGLYTGGYISYPRTEHRELPNEAYNDAVETLRVLAGYGFQPAGQAADRHDRSDAQRPRAYKNKNMEHHGLMPTTTAPDPGKLGKQEQALYEMVCRRYIEAHLPDATTEITAVQAKPDVTGLVSDHPARFSKKIERLVDAGWMAAFGQTDEDLDDDNTLAQLASDGATIADTPVTTGKTKPPAHYTENTLLAAMKNAARFLDGADAKTLHSANGLGTPATRANVIETLLAREYLNKNKARITVTSKGADLINNTPDQLGDIKQTAEWEAVLSAIENMDDQQAIAKRDEFIQQQADHLTGLLNTIVQSMKDHNMSNGQGGGNAPTDKMTKLAGNISHTLGIDPPDGCDQDFDTCRSFIDEHIEDYKARSPSTNPPTTKMLSFAEKTAKNQGIELPDEARQSFDACKAFLDDNADNNSNPPTPKMRSFAESLARDKKLDLPEGYDASFDTCKAFLDANA